MIKRNYLVLISLLIMMSCKLPKEPADLIIYNARVYTVDSDFSIQEALVVTDGVIVAVGKNEEILGQFNSENTVDADGKAIYPGFNDAHCHFYGYGTNLVKRANLVGTKSFEEVIDRLQEHNNQFPSAWLEGRGWDQNDWANKTFPTKDLLDEAFPEKPIYLIRIDGHAALVNSAALKLAGIDNTTQVDGGDIINLDGKVTGVLIDNAMNLVSSLIPSPNEDFNITALKLAQENCFEVGLTSVSDAGLSKEIVQLIDKLQTQGDLKMRINAMLAPSEENYNHFITNGPFQNDFLTIRSIKLYADGALGSRGAKMIEPYSDQHDHTGLMMHPPEFYDTWCQRAFDHNYQVNTHAIGDGGNRFILETYARFLKGKNDRRWRVEHAQVVHPDDFKLFGQNSIIPSVQPTHATSDMYWADERVGEVRIKGAYAFKQLLDQNNWIPLGTDFPIESINPLYTFYAAVSRKDSKGWPEEGFQMENALSREEALRGITIWAAKAAFEEDKKGSLEVGKFADFVILEEDIMKSELSAILKIAVSATYLNGQKVYYNN